MGLVIGGEGITLVTTFILYSIMKLLLYRYCTNCNVVQDN